MKPTILVTAAAGHTGSPAVIDLLQRGFPVRAFVRRRDARSAALERAGAELFVGDLNDHRDLERALRGVQRAYYCPPFGPNVLEAAMLFATAAEEAGLELVVLMNAWNAHPSHPALHQREQWLAAQLYRWLPTVDLVTLEPGMFAFAYFLGLPAVVHFGQLMLPFADGRNAPPSNEDIAAMAAAILAEPAPHVGRRYRPTGAELISGSDAAAAFSTVLGRPVSYRPVPVRMFIKAALAQGFPPFQVSHVRRYAEEVQNGLFAIGAPNDHVERVTGRPAEDFTTIVRRYVRDPSRVWPGLSADSRAAAAWLMLRTVLQRVPDLDRWESERGYPSLPTGELAHQSARWLSEHAP